MSKEIQEKVDTVARLFEEFKSANDRKITDTASNLNEAITKIQDEQKAIKLALVESKAVDVVGEAKDKAGFEARKAFKNWMSNGQPGTPFAKSLEMKSTGNITTGADGGYGVPTVIQEQVDLIIKATSPVESVTAPVSIGTQSYIKLLDNNDSTAGWVAETGTRTGTSAQTFTRVTITPQELYANPQISLQMLEDVQFDAEAELLTSLGDQLGRTRSAAFVNGLGSGSNQPVGFLKSGSLLTATSSTTAAIISDDIYTLIYGLLPGYRKNGTFAMSRQILQTVRTLKDSYGRYMWEPNYQSGQPSTLAGYAVVEFDDMPSVTTTGTNVIAFADFQKFYRVVQRVGLMLLRDPYSVEGSVVYKTRQRVGGDIETAVAGLVLVTK